MSDPLEQMILSFTEHLRFEKRYSRHTLRAYHDDLLQFRDYLQAAFGNIAPQEISAAVVRSWLASLKESGITSRSITRKISTLKSFFKHAMRSGRLSKSPMAAVTAPRSSARLPVFVEEKHLDGLFRHADFSDGWNGRTARLALQMLYQLGLRVSELTGCRESQVDIGQRQIRVLGKGNKERIVPISAELATELGEYIGRKGAELEQPDRAFLLVNDKGKKLYPQYVYRLTVRYLSQVTTVAKKSPHVLRHSFATHLSNNGAELNAVKELLGHASLAATQVYTHNTIEKLKNVHKKAHPRG